MSVQTKKKAPLELAIPAAMPDASHHVEDGDARRKDRPEEDDDIPRSPFGEHQRSVQPDDEEDHDSEVREPSRGDPADDVVRR